jgi:hypothetical protein
MPLINRKILIIAHAYNRRHTRIHRPGVAQDNRIQHSAFRSVDISALRNTRKHHNHVHEQQVPIYSLSSLSSISIARPGITEDPLPLGSALT